MENLNIQLFTAINSFAGKHPLLDYIAQLGSEYLPFVFIVYLVHVWIFKPSNFKSIVLMCSYTTILALTLSYVIGFFYFHERPFVMNLGTQLVFHAPDTSCPSDHTVFMSSIAIMLLFYRETRSASIILICAALLGGLARVFSGVHFPFDIFAAFFVSGISTVLMYLIRNSFHSINELLINIGNVVAFKR